MQAFEQFPTQSRPVSVQEEAVPIQEEGVSVQEEEGAQVSRQGLVLCVDDEPSVLTTLARGLEWENHEVLRAENGQQALEILAERPVDLVISDMRMPLMSGTEFLCEVAGRWPDTVRVLLTGHADIQSAISAVNDGEIYRYLTKPCRNDELKQVVRDGIEKRWMKRERDRLSAIIREQHRELERLHFELEKRGA